MKTKHNVGDIVAVVCRVKSIEVDGYGEKYHVMINRADGAPPLYADVSSYNVLPLNQEDPEVDDLK